ncbi:MAG: hypothetical protein P8L85_10850 [Rubripirellula sp.]|nr:hypothetical protein [Rubripirellula sp.]
MSHFYLHPDDRRWLKRWFRNNLVCVVAIIAFVSLLHFSAVVQDSVSANAVQRPDRVVTPEGWRRTTRGWEHTSQWHFNRADASSVSDSPPQVQSRQVQSRWVQSRWVTGKLETLRRISPLVIAMTQIAAVAIIICLSGRARRSVRNGEADPVS